MNDFMGSNPHNEYYDEIKCKSQNSLSPEMFLAMPLLTCTPRGAMSHGRSDVAFASSILSRAESSHCLFLISKVDRCSYPLAGAPGCLLDGFQSVHNAAARLFCNNRKYDHITLLLCNILHWLRVAFRIEYKIHDLS